MDGLKIISAGVGPIIVISACGLLCLALYNRLAAVVTRLRGFHRERWQEQDRLLRQRQSAAPDEQEIVRHQEMLGVLQVQIEHVRRRARWLQLTLYCFLSTIGCLAICSLAVGLSTVVPGLAYLAAATFILGLLLLITGVIFALVEMKHALDPVSLESRFVSELMEGD